MFQSQTDEAGRFRALHRVPTVMARSHWHLHLEIIYCVGTPLVYEFAGREVVVESGEVMLFWAALPHRVLRSDSNGEVFVINIPLESAFQWNFSRKQIAAYLGGEAKVVVPPAHFGLEAFRSWFCDLNSDDLELQQIVQLELQSLIRRIDGLEARRAFGQSGQSRTRSKNFGTVMRTIVELMQSERGADISVQAIADAMDMNPKYLTTTFKANTGVTLGTYIRRSKVAAARTLLLDTNLSTIQVAHESGFGSLSQFYAVMKSETDLTPRQIRSRNP